MINWNSKITHYIYINSNNVFFNENEDIPVYGLLDYIANEQFVLFLKFDFDFEGGVNIGKAIGKR
jgi:endoglucanase Acf2